MIFKPLFSLSYALLQGLLLCAACNHADHPEPIQTDSTLQKSRYVSVTGNDQNKGTESKPFRTIARALDAISPGDTIFVREGAYHEKVLISKSGSSAKLITIKPYPNEAVAIDGEGLSISGTEALVTIRNARFIQFDGFEIRNFKTQAKGNDVNGIIIDQGSKNITIRNNRVHHIENNTSPQDGRSGHGILVIGNTNEALQDIIVEDNTIHDCNTGYSENLTINGYVDGFIIRRNKVYNGENIGIVAAGGYAANATANLNYVRNGLISQNEVYDIDGRTGPIPAFAQHNGAIGIYIDGARDIIVERNSVYRCGRGIGLVSETDHFPTRDCIVRNNKVYHNSLAGISLGGYLNYTGGGTLKCYVVNNTLFHNNIDKGYFDEIEGEIRLVENCTENIIQNNIIVAHPNSVFIHKYTNTGKSNAIDYNLYFSTGEGQWIWNGKVIRDQQTWKSTLIGDTHTIFGQDPGFISTTQADFGLRHSSPALAKGNFIGEAIHGELDLSGQARIEANRISIGAFQK
ncbi:MULTISPECIES: DUF1565 domain-containing protein [Sphingobacterium]|uniref:DUF1565 domain-containing protein n=1 Tax=Sphingobacterium TaxID=28453 RepID=UPI0025798840|nr:MULTISPECIES: right-handed parallel beta-helix repeat-containing protein [Sphingobacterium]